MPARSIGGVRQLVMLGCRSSLGTNAHAKRTRSPAVLQCVTAMDRPLVASPPPPTCVCVALVLCRPPVHTSPTQLANQASQDHAPSQPWLDAANRHLGSRNRNSKPSVRVRPLVRHSPCGSSSSPCANSNSPCASSNNRCASSNSSSSQGDSSIRGVSKLPE